jgi:hypothetical protein
MIESMTAEATEAPARGLQVAGDPTRLRLFAGPKGGTRCVREMREPASAPEAEAP